MRCEFCGKEIQKIEVFKCRYCDKKICPDCRVPEQHCCPAITHIIGKNTITRIIPKVM